MRATVRRLARAAGVLLAAIAGLTVLYGVVAVAAALLPWGMVPRDGAPLHPVYLLWSDIHSDIVLPVRGLSVDWQAVLGDPDVPQPLPEGGWLAFGWGSESFYRDVPTMADMTPAIVARALLLDQTVVHVAPLPDPMWIVPERRLTLFVSEESVVALEQHVLATLVRDGAGRADALAGATYGYGDAFFRAEGRYNPVRTCNRWTGEGLRSAGIAAGFWTPFVQSITWVLGSDAERAAAAGG